MINVIPFLFKGVTKLFEEFDQNKNSALEMKELAQLNLKLFFTIPRFGVVGMFNKKWLRGLIKLLKLYSSMFFIAKTWLIY